MSEVRCPMCSKVNLADAEVCEFCAARIKPLMLDPEDDQGKTEWPSADSRPHSETEEPVKEYEEETLSVTSWLGQMREETPDFPDAKVQEDEDTYRTSEGLLHAQADEVEVPASLREYAETADDGIEWLNRFRAEGAADEEHAEDEPAPGAGQKLGESEELPDLEQPEGAPEISADDSWLADFRSEAIEEGEHLPEKEEVDQGEDDTLAWLRELTEQEEPVLESEPEFVSESQEEPVSESELAAGPEYQEEPVPESEPVTGPESQEDPVFESEPVAASEPSEEAPIIDSIPRTATPADQDISLANYNFDAILDAREDESDTGAAEDKDAESTEDWLSDFMEEKSDQQNKLAEDHAVEDIPEWLDQLQEKEAGVVAPWADVTAPLPHPELPEDSRMSGPPDSGFPRQDTAWKELEDLVGKPDSPDSTLDTPAIDWLSDEVPETSAQDVVEAEIPAADIPDWMEGIRERQSKETRMLPDVPESPSVEQAAKADVLDIPDTDWLQELTEEKTEQAAVDEQLSAADIPDWMEGLRERQSKETHLFVEPAAETEVQSVRTDQLPEGERTTGDDPVRPAWLEDITETAFQDTDANAGQADAAATDIPDWLGNIWEDHLDSQQSVKELPVSSKDIPTDEMGAMEEARIAEARFPESAHALDDSDLSSEAGLPDGELPAATMPEWLSNIRDRQTKETGTLNDEGQSSDPDSGLSAGDPGAELVYSADRDQTLEPIESDESTAAIPGWLKEMHDRPGVEAGQLQPVDEEGALPGMHEQPETEGTDSMPAGTDAGIPESTIDFSFLDEEATVEESVDEIAAPDWLTGLRTMPVQGDWPAADSESAIYETTEQEQKDAEAGVRQAPQADDSSAEPDQLLQDERVLAESEASLAEIGKEIQQDEEPDAVHAELEFKPLEDVSFTPAAGLEEDVPESISVADLFPPEPDADALAVGDSDLNAANMPDWLQGIHARQSKETRMLELPDEMKAPDMVADIEASSELESTAIWPPPRISEQEKITTKESKKELDQLSQAVPSSDVVSEPAPSLTADSSALSDLQSEESGTRPVWLEDLPELTSIDRPSAPAFIPGVDMMADQSQDEVGEDEEQSPHWMDGVQADAAQEQVPEAFAGADLARATLPVWLEAMRPVESSSSIARDGEAVAEPVETAGPLAGLQGVLAAEPFMETSMAARTAGTSLLISEREYARSELLKRLIADEERELTSTIKQKDRMGLMRWITATILVLAVLIPALFGFPSYKQPVSEPLGLVRLFETVNSLPADNPALLIFDYEPGFAPEMEAVAGTILHHLAVRQIPMVTLATHPAGLPLADRLIQKTIDVNSFQMGEDYVHLGYLAGGSIGIQAFVAAPRSAVLSGYMLPEIYRQESGGVWTTPILSEVEKISDFGLVCVIASDAEAARDWIEQAGSSINNVPLLVVISYGAEPMIRPYYEGASAPVDGIIAGLASAAAYDLRFNRTSDAQRLWNSYNTGVVAAFLIIVIGGGVNITRWILQNRRPPESESAE